MVERCELWIYISKALRKRTNLNKQVRMILWKSVFARVENVNKQDKLEQLGEDIRVEETELAHVKGVNLQDKIKQVVEDEGVEESVLAPVEGVQGEDSGMKAVTQSHQGMHNLGF
jgi:hypothetical protein